MPFDAIGTENDAVCPTCSQSFTKRRRDQKYCAPKCRKQNYQQRDRAKNPRNAKNSKETASTNRRHYERALYLAEMLYGLPTSERLGFMKELIDAARSGDAKMKSIFTDPKLLNASHDEPWLFYRSLPTLFLTISQAANEYCKCYWNSSVGPVVRGEVPEPPTGEVFS